jgi:hypothetical protein
VAGSCEYGDEAPGSGATELDLESFSKYQVLYLCQCWSIELNNSALKWRKYVSQKP